MEVVIGLVIGFAIGATGVGGGTLMVPALVFLLGFQARTAVATALIFSTCVKVLASGVYCWHRKVDFHTLVYLLYGGLPGAIIGAVLLNRAHTQGSEAWIFFTVGLIVIVSAGLSLFHGVTANTRWKPRAYLLPFLSFILGIETGFSSAGAGALGTVMLFNLTALSPALVVGTNLLFGLVISATAGGIDAANCDFHALARLVPAGLLGVYIGSRVSLGLSVNVLRKTLLYCTILLGALLLGKGLAAI
jgi:uncharacterized protein